jgi:hypothetical protein
MPHALTSLEMVQPTTESTWPFWDWDSFWLLPWIQWTVIAESHQYQSCMDPYWTCDDCVTGGFDFWWIRHNLTFINHFYFYLTPKIGWVMAISLFKWSHIWDHRWKSVNCFHVKYILAATSRMWYSLKSCRNWFRNGILSGIQIWILARKKKK